MTLRVATRGLSVGIALALLVGCGGGGGSSSTTTPPPSTPDFTLSASPSTLNIARASSANVQVTVTPQHGFTGTVTVTPAGLPNGVSASPVDINAGSSGTLAFTVETSAGSGSSTISLAGKSGALSHSTSVTVTVPFGGGVLTIVPRTSGTSAVPPNAATYLTKLLADIAPERLQECGAASSSPTIEIIFTPGQGWHFDDNNKVITMNELPDPGASGADKSFDERPTHESAHALQYDILHNVTHRGTFTAQEGFAQSCAFRVVRILALSGKRPEDHSAAGALGDLGDSTLRFDLLRRVDSQAIAAAGRTSNPFPYDQPSRSLGEAAYLIVASQPVMDGMNGVVAHENALFAAESSATAPLTPQDRINLWDSLGITLDGQTAGAWMPDEMIEDPPFTVGPKLLAWTSLPQYPTDIFVQAFTITAVADVPTIAPVDSGPVTITVLNSQGKSALSTIQTDLAQTSDPSNPFFTQLPNKLSQGTYTVVVDVTVNGMALEERFAVAVVPPQFTGSIGLNELSFPGQYLVAVDSAGDANGGSLTVTRGKTVFTMAGFAIVKPDSTGTFDVTGPSGTKHTYTAPEPWARFIPVE